MSENEEIDYDKIDKEVFLDEFKSLSDENQIKVGLRLL